MSLQLNLCTHPSYFLQNTFVEGKLWDNKCAYYNSIKDVEARYLMRPPQLKNKLTLNYSQDEGLEKTLGYFFASKPVTSNATRNYFQHPEKTTHQHRTCVQAYVLHWASTALTRDKSEDFTSSCCDHPSIRKKNKKTKRGMQISKDPEDMRRALLHFVRESD